MVLFFTLIEPHFLDIAKVERKSLADPDTITNHLDGESVIFVTNFYGLSLTDTSKEFLVFKLSILLFLMNYLYSYLNNKEDV